MAGTTISRAAVVYLVVMVTAAVLLQLLDWLVD